jgi:nucleoid-associated protein YgaU
MKGESMSDTSPQAAPDEPIVVSEPDESVPAEAPAETEPVEAEPVVDTSVEAPVDAEPVETSPVETAPIESSPAEAPAEPEPIESAPVETTPVEPVTLSDESIDAIAKEVIAGLWGSGEQRKEHLSASGYDFDVVQSQVNARLYSGSSVYQTYTVQPGDTLQGIAGRLRYTGGWQALHGKNKGVIGVDPNIIHAGQIISL